MLNNFKIRNHLVKMVLISIVFFCVADLTIAKSTSAWSCGSWVTDSTDSCKEVQKCTRTFCSAKGKIDNCVIETQTSTATKANCPPLNQKPAMVRFTKGTNSSGVMALPSVLSPKKPKPFTSLPILQPNVMTRKPIAPKPVINEGVKPVINGSITGKKLNKRKPVIKVTKPININKTNLPHSRNRPTIKLPSMSGVPVVRTNKPQNRNLMAVPVLNGTSGLTSFNKSVNSRNANQLPTKKPSSGFVPSNIANTPATNTLDSRAVKSGVKTYNAVEYKEGANLVISARWVSDSANWLMDKCILKEPHGFKPRHTDVWATSCDLVVTIKNVGDIVVPRAVVNGDSESGNIIESRVQVSYKKIRGNGRVLDAKLKRRLNPIQPGQIVTVVFEKGYFDSFYGLSQLIKIKVNLRNEFVETKKSDNLVNIRISDF